MLLLEGGGDLPVLLQGPQQDDALHAGAEGVPELERNHAQREQVHFLIGVVAASRCLWGDVKGGAHLTCGLRGHTGMRLQPGMLPLICAAAHLLSAILMWRMSGLCKCEKIGC